MGVGVGVGGVENENALTLQGHKARTLKKCMKNQYFGPKVMVVVVWGGGAAEYNVDVGLLLWPTPVHLGIFLYFVHLPTDRPTIFRLLKNCNVNCRFVLV